MGDPVESVAPEYVRTALFTSDRKRVAMFVEQDIWDLPYFVYPESLYEGNDIGRCCQDLEKLLGVDPQETYLVASVELQGAFSRPCKFAPHEKGDESLVVMEAHPEGQDESVLRAAPESFEWKDGEFLSLLLKGPERTPMSTQSLRIIYDLMCEGSVTRSSLTDPRYQPGWYSNVSIWLTELVQSLGYDVYGHVIQVQVSCSSSLLKVNSSGGWLFAKAPSLGCNEGPITAALAGLFPEHMPTVVGVHPELNVFVSREFADDGLSEDHLRDVVLRLGEMQIKSLPHLDEVKEAGCPFCGPDEIVEYLEQWSQGDDIITEFNGVTDHIRKLVPYIRDMCSELKKYSIPLSLIHGDPALWNAAFASVSSHKVILFDWEFAAVGHPFADFHRLHDSLPPDLVDEYLRMWSAYEDLDRAQEAFRIGRKLGWIVKIVSFRERAKACNPQLKSLLERWALIWLDRAFEDIIVRRCDGHAQQTNL